MKKLICLIILIFVPSFIHSQLSTQLLLQTLQQNPSLLLSNPELLRQVISATSQQSQQPQPQPQLRQQPRRDECSALKKQNKLLRQMLSSVTGPGVLNDLDFTESVKSQQVVSPAEALLKQVQNQQPQALKPTISLTSSLVTPPATWTTSMTTTSYVTTVTHTETQEIPILLRGQKVHTTFKICEKLQIFFNLFFRWSQPFMSLTPKWSQLQKSRPAQFT